MVSCGGSGGGGSAKAVLPSTTTLEAPLGVSPVPPVNSVTAGPRAAVAGTTEYERTRPQVGVQLPGVELGLTEELLELLGRSRFQDNLGATYRIHDGLGHRLGSRYWVVAPEAVPDGNGNAASKVDVKLWRLGPDGKADLKVRFELSDPAQFAADDTQLTGGTWKLVAEDATGDPLLMATGKAMPDGSDLVRLLEKKLGDPLVRVRRAELFLGLDGGFGKLEAAERGGGSPLEWIWGYDARQILLRRKRSGLRIDDRYLDRDRMVEDDARYALFDPGTGANVEDGSCFGFDVRYQQDGGPAEARYHLDKGRHRLRTASGILPPDGTVVRPTDANLLGETFKTQTVAGTLTKWAAVPGNLDELANVPLEINDNFYLELKWDGKNWTENGVAYPNLAYLQGDQLRDRLILATRAGGQTKLVGYEANGPAPGFYEGLLAKAVLGAPALELGAIPYVPREGDTLLVSGWGTSYIVWDKIEWLVCQVDGIDPVTRAPLFNPVALPYALDLNRSYVVEPDGVPTTVTRTSSQPDQYTVVEELPLVDNPNNVADLLQGVAGFHEEPSELASLVDLVAPTFTFVLDPVQKNWFTLAIATPGSFDTFLGKTLGYEPVGSPVLGHRILHALGTDHKDLPDGEFTWDAPGLLDTQAGIQVFLYQGPDEDRQYRTLDPPITLADLDLTTGNGGSRTARLRFDGELRGRHRLPEKLRLTGGQLTDAVAGQAETVPAGTVVADRTDPTRRFRIRPRKRKFYPRDAAAPEPALGAILAKGENLDLDADLPDPEGTGLGDAPDATELPMRYKDGHQPPQ
jgi:hypothetical protein